MSTVPTLNTEDVNELLDEEAEEEKQFHLSAQPASHLSLGLVHSPTTDTLDSVYLEPSITDPDSAHETDTPEKFSATIGLGMEETEKVTEIDIQDRAITEIDLGAEENKQMGDPNDPNGPSMTESNLEKAAESGVNLVEDVEPNGADGDRKKSQPSLSKYFGTDSESADPFAEDFFSTIPGIEDDVNTTKANEGATEDTAKPYSTDKDETLEEMLNLKPDDQDNIFSLDENILEGNENNNYRPNDNSLIESVDFDLELDQTDTVETPVAIEEKDDFESFTAELADTETMDALGMSPAAPSYMTDRNINDYFKQTSQSDSIKSLNLGRQMSVQSTKSASSTEQGFTAAATHTGSLSSESELSSQPGASQVADIMKEEESGEATPTHQPMFPPSTTFSPVDSPIHQPAFHTERQISVPGDASVGAQPSPEHRPSAFQTFPDTESSAADPFAAISNLQMSDSDRSHDAWIPSEATKNILVTMGTHPEGSYVPDRDLLCCPSLVITDPQGDPVRDLVHRYMGEQEALKRKTLTMDTVSKDTDGLKKLMESGCFRSAINLTGYLLQEAGQGTTSDTPTIHSQQTLQIWFCRLSLLIKLRMYNIVESEFVAFRNLDTPDIYYEYYPQLYAGKRGSMMPFGMRLIHAELPHHMGRSQEALDRFYYILAITQKILKNLADGMAEDGCAMTISAESRKVSTELWEEREKQVLYAIGNTLVSLKDYDAALSVFEILLEKDSVHQTALLCGLGRVHLQIGNLTKAMEYFHTVTAAVDQADKTSTILMSRGFEAMCQNNFSEAYQNFKSAVQADPSNTSAVNNMAVCCLYLGKLKEALKSLETLVHGNPEQHLHEGILFNLCTLYELESSRALHKKQALLDLVSKHKGDGFQVICLKMA